MQNDVSIPSVKYSCNVKPHKCYNNITVMFMHLYPACYNCFMFKIIIILKFISYVFFNRCTEY